MRIEALCSREMFVSSGLTLIIVKRKHLELAAQECINHACRSPVCLIYCVIGILTRAWNFRRFNSRYTQLKVNHAFCKHKMKCMAAKVLLQFLKD